MKYSKLGYKRYSPDLYRKYNIIPSGNITMRDVDFPVYGIDNLGNQQMMYPGNDYTFPGNEVLEIPQFGKGGLKQWFDEKWVDIKTGKPCGRSGKDKKGRPYPACRPSRRVNSTTPKTASELSAAEKAKFKRKKKSGKRIDYNHKRAFGGSLPLAQFGGRPGDVFQEVDTYIKPGQRIRPNWTHSPVSVTNYTFGKTLLDDEPRFSLSLQGTDILDEIKYRADAIGSVGIGVGNRKGKSFRPAGENLRAGIRGQASWQGVPGNVIENMFGRNSGLDWRGSFEGEAGLAYANGAVRPYMSVMPQTNVFLNDNLSLGIGMEMRGRYDRNFDEPVYGNTDTGSIAPITQRDAYSGMGRGAARFSLNYDLGNGDFIEGYYAHPDPFYQGSMPGIREMLALESEQPRFGVRLRKSFAKGGSLPSYQDNGEIPLGRSTAWTSNHDGYKMLLKPGQKGFDDWDEYQHRNTMYNDSLMAANVSNQALAYLSQTLDPSIADRRIITDPSALPGKGNTVLDWDKGLDSMFNDSDIDPSSYKRGDIIPMTGTFASDVMEVPSLIHKFSNIDIVEKNRIPLSANDYLLINKNNAPISSVTFSPPGGVVSNSDYYVGPGVIQGTKGNYKGIDGVATYDYWYYPEANEEFGNDVTVYQYQRPNVQPVFTGTKPSATKAVAPLPTKPAPQPKPVVENTSKEQITKTVKATPVPTMEIYSRELNQQTGEWIYETSEGNFRKKIGPEDAAFVKENMLAIDNYRKARANKKAGGELPKAQEGGELPTFTNQELAMHLRKLVAQGVPIEDMGIPIESSFVSPGYTDEGDLILLRKPDSKYNDDGSAEIQLDYWNVTGNYSSGYNWYGVPIKKKKSKYSNREYEYIDPIHIDPWVETTTLKPKEWRSEVQPLEMKYINPIPEIYSRKMNASGTKVTYETSKGTFITAKDPAVLPRMMADLKSQPKNALGMLPMLDSDFQRMFVKQEGGTHLVGEELTNKINNAATEYLTNTEREQNEKFNRSKEFVEGWTNSLMHDQMLSNSLSGEQERITRYKKGRLQNIQTIPSLNIQYQQPSWSELGAGSLSTTGQIIAFPNGFNLPTAYTHEITHSSDRPNQSNGRLIPESDINLMQEYFVASDSPFRQPYDEYVAKPSETRARLMEVRDIARQKGIYDPYNEKLSKSAFDEFLLNYIDGDLKSDKDFRESPLIQLMQAYTEDQIFDMLNTISSANSNIDNLPYAEKGGSLPSYQTRGEVPNEILNWQDNAEWFNNRAVFSDDLRYNDLIKKLTLAGTHGFNPTTGTLHKLETPVTVDQDIVENVTRGAAKRKVIADRKKAEEENLKKWQDARELVDISEVDAWSPDFNFETRTGIRNANDFRGQQVYMTPEEAENYHQAMMSKNINYFWNSPLMKAPGYVFLGATAPWLLAGMSAVEAADDLSKGNYGDAALSAVGALPIVPSGLKNVKRAYNKVATGNSILPVAWKMEDVSKFVPTSSIKTTATLTDKEAKIIGKYLQDPYIKDPGSFNYNPLFDQVVQKNKGIYSNVSVPFTRVEGYASKTTPISNKYGSTFSYDGSKSWSLGARFDDKNLANLGKTRLVIPSRYSKNLDFMPVDYTDARILQGAQEEVWKSGLDKFAPGLADDLTRFVPENEIIGNVPNGFKVIGRSNEQGFNNIFIKPFKTGGSLSSYQDKGEVKPTRNEKVGRNEIPENKDLFSKYVMYPALLEGAAFMDWYGPKVNEAAGTMTNLGMQALYSDPHTAAIAPALHRGTNEWLFENVRPVAYPTILTGITEVASGMMGYNAPPSLDADGDYTVDEEAWRRALGLKTTPKYIVPSQYKPSTAEDPNAQYYTISPSVLDRQKLIQEAQARNMQVGDKAYLESMAPYIVDGYMSQNEFSEIDPLQRFKMSVGEDDKGRYLSIYDKYDLSGPANELIYPYEFYDRVYYKRGGRVPRYKANLYR